ncbi:penicillin-binding protein 2 [Candidatus Uhrbacteria bacterium]|nr:penicillin-binding protein 2 [Candidatus Uhrbacteria bacterium]
MNARGPGVRHSFTPHIINTGQRYWIGMMGCALIAVLIISRLFWIQIIRSSGNSGQDIFVRRQKILKVLPSRGEISITDDHGQEELPAAANQPFVTVYAVPPEVEEGGIVSEQLARLLSLDPKEVAAKLSKRDTQYAALKRRVDVATAQQIEQQHWKGIYTQSSAGRIYPEKELLGSITGFVRQDDDTLRGQYGIEGYFDKELSGQKGWEYLLRDGRGRLIPAPGTSSSKPMDGINIILTIERSVQFTACEALKETVDRFKALGGSVIVLNPKTGAIRALCSLPSFDPNSYNAVGDIGVYNHLAVDDAYEPGSVMKVITMAAGIEEKAVNPKTTYVDQGFVSIGPDTIHNAADKSYGLQDMVGVLKESINTGAVFVAQRLGGDRLTKYIKNFQFGQLTGIELPNENSGWLSSLGKPQFIYTATASFGQGITVTPIQLARAFSAIANGGELVAPTIIQSFRTSDGITINQVPKPKIRVISPETSSLISSMMVEVVEEGHSKGAAAPGYYIAGKTGTAQIAAQGARGYTSKFNHTFVGFGPVEDPSFLVVVSIKSPEALYAEATAVPTAGKIIKFLLPYDQIPPTRTISR